MGRYAGPARYVVVLSIEDTLLFAADEAGLRWSLDVQQAHRFGARPKATALANHLGSAALVLPPWFIQRHIQARQPPPRTLTEWEAACSALPYNLRKRVLMPPELEAPKPALLSVAAIRSAR